MAVCTHLVPLTKREHDRSLLCVHPAFIFSSFNTPVTSPVERPSKCPRSVRGTTFLPSTSTISRSFKHSQLSNKHHTTPVATLSRSRQIREHMTDVSESAIKVVEALRRQPLQTVADMAAAAGIPLTMALRLSAFQVGP